MPHKTDSGDENVDLAVGSRGEIYIEYKQVGQTMKVIAVDAATGIEAVIMGPASAAQAQLKKVAVQKLQMLLNKSEKTEDDAVEEEAEDSPAPGKKGWTA